MAKSSSEQMRSWQGPAVLSFGFRPFFLGAAIWAAMAMLLWVLMLTGSSPLPIAWDATSWHAHAFLFGYLSAVIAGFLLTAVPNWTGRLPVVGWKLGGLFGLWLLGRIAVATSAGWHVVALATVDLAFPLVLGALILREIVIGKNWRNLPVLALLAVFALANLLFHWEAARGGYAAQGIGLRLGIATVLMMIALIGGRIVPSFTRNWMVRQGVPDLPSPPIQRYDKAALAVTLVGLGCWTAFPQTAATGVLLILVGLIQAGRLARWQGHRAGAEPLVWVLHVGYAFVPLGALAQGGAILLPDAAALASAQHIWMAGAFGLMTLAVMTRATLGHSGRDLHANSATVAIYLCIIGSVLVRALAGVLDQSAEVLHLISAILWVSAFLGFGISYGPLLLRTNRHATP